MKFTHYSDLLRTLLCSALCNPKTVACQAPLSMEFSRQEFWSELLFPLRADLPILHLLWLLPFRQILYHCATWETQCIINDTKTVRMRYSLSGV